MEKLCFVPFSSFGNDKLSLILLFLSVVFMFASILVNKNKNKNDTFLTLYFTLIVFAAGSAVVSVLIVKMKECQNMIIGVLFVVPIMISAFSTILITEKKSYILSLVVFYFSVFVIFLSHIL